MGICEGGTSEKKIVTLFDLLNGVGVVVASHPSCQLIIYFYWNRVSLMGSLDVIVDARTKSQGYLHNLEFWPSC